MKTKEEILKINKKFKSIKYQDPVSKGVRYYQENQNAEDLKEKEE